MIITIPPTPNNVAEILRDFTDDYWQYSKLNRSMETDTIFIDTVEFGINNVKLPVDLVLTQANVDDSSDVEHIKQRVKKLRSI